MTRAARDPAAALAGVWLLLLGGPAVRAQSPADLPLPLPTATAHPAVPTSVEEVWIAPTGRPTASMQALARAAQLIADDKAAQAAPLLKKASLAGTPLADYERYYTGLAQFRLGRVDAARATLDALVKDDPHWYLAIGARQLAGEVAEAQGDFAAAAAYYEPLTHGIVIAPDAAWSRLARVKQALGDAQGAAEAYARVYFEYPLSDLANAASAQVDALHAWEPLSPGSPRYTLELGRAERLFGARRYAEARDGFSKVASLASGDDKERVALRLAECDFYLKRYQAARDALEPWTSGARRRAEARYFYLSSLRGLKDNDEYERLARALVDDYPTDSWAEETLNNLGSHYIIQDEDVKADAVFRELATRFPEGRYAQRAYWKMGWNAYRTGNWDECARTFEQAATKFPRADYRPSWLYWAARSREQLGDTATADRLYGVLVADYVNSYYGRLATRQLTARHVEPMSLAASVATKADAVPAITDGAAPDDIPNAELIRALITAGLYDAALSEVQWAQKAVGESARLQATTGLIYSRQGDLRKGITAIKRAFPQYLSANGGDLPPDVLKVLFPVAYWDLIERYGTAHKLDPYVLAALIAQESTFDAEIVSHAHAIGLMQIVAPTGRSYARRLRIRPYSTRRLTDPKVNMQIGTAYFADLVDRFGGVPFALASYNAGPGPVARWIAERPGIALDEFIDDIPYPETQNYVRKILGTAEDYRQLYGERGVEPLAGAPGSAPLPAARASAAPVRTHPTKAPAKKAQRKKVSRRKH